MKPVKDNEDSAVSEIIGALLLFAIGTTVLTGFILWYVPSTGMTNDQGYQSATQSAFTTLDSKILSPSLAPGSAVSQSFPLGVSGAPPFSSPTDSSLCYSNNFSASMKENFSLSYYNRLPVKSNLIAAATNATPSSIYNNIYADNQFFYSVNFIENGLTFGNYWTVSLDGRAESSTSNLISFSFPQGTYSYKISTSSNQLMSTQEGAVVVSNSVNIPVTFFTSKLHGILAENNGTSGDLNSINTQNQIGTYSATFSNIVDITYNDNWLNGTYNSSIKANELGSQAFSIYSSEPVNYYLYYLMASQDYGYQYFIGPYSVVSYISNTPFGKNITSPSYFNSSNQVNEYIKVTLKKPVYLSQGTYYLNFYEKVNSPKSKNLQSTYTPLLLGNGTKPITNPILQWEYGPTEFVGVMSSSQVSAGVGNSIAFKAEYYECAPSFSNFNNFTILNDNEAIYSNIPYVFVVGYNVTGISENVKFSESGLPTGQEWNVTINGKAFSSIKSELNISEPAGSYLYGVNSSLTELATPSTGMVNVTTTTAKNAVNVTFSTPRGSNPEYYGITYTGTQQIVLKQKAKFNYISLYLYNFTIPSSSYKKGPLNNNITVTISNSTSTPYKEAELLEVNNTGWDEIFFYTNGEFKTLYPGYYNITVSSIDGSNNIIGWGFSTSGGFDNYLETDSSNQLFTDTNVTKASTITNYNTGASIQASNQVFMLSVGYYNLTETSTLLHTNLTFIKSVSGEILSNGFTQFTYQAVFAIQDGSSLEASKGVTYATVNPLPIQIAGNKSNVAFDSNIYSIDVIKAIPTSISGDGSTILSMDLTNRSGLNYTINDSYFFSYGTSSIYAKVVNITLTKFNYTISSQFSKYWADSFFTQLPVNNSDKSNAHFNVVIRSVNAFNITLGYDRLYFSMNNTALPNGLSLYSISNLYQSYLVTQV